MSAVGVLIKELLSQVFQPLFINYRYDLKSLASTFSLDGRQGVGVREKPNRHFTLRPSTAEAGGG